VQAPGDSKIHDTFSCQPDSLYYEAGTQGSYEPHTIKMLCSNGEKKTFIVTAVIAGGSSLLFNINREDKWREKTVQASYHLSSKDQTLGVLDTLRIVPDR